MPTLTDTEAARIAEELAYELTRADDRIREALGVRSATDLRNLQVAGAYKRAWNAVVDALGRELRERNYHILKHVFLVTILHPPVV